MSQEAKYLGDGVYVQRDGEDVVLTTGTHVREDADGVVVLDPEVVSALVRWLTPPSITILTDAFTKDQLAAIDLMIEAVVPPGTPRELLGLLPVGPERPAWERDAVLSRAAAPTPAPYVTPNAHACKPVARGGGTTATNAVRLRRTRTCPRTDTPPARAAARWITAFRLRSRPEMSTRRGGQSARSSRTRARESTDPCPECAPKPEPKPAKAKAKKARKP